MYNYLTLQAVKNYIGGGIGEVDDELLAEFIDWASRLIEDYKGRRYDVRLETRVYDTPRVSSSNFGAYDSRYPAYQADPPLRLDEDLLEPVELLNGDGEELASGTYMLEPANFTPKNRIRLRSGYTWEPSEDGPEQAIQLSGLWGYHNRYAEAWVLGGIIDDDVEADDLSLPVADLGSFQIGQLARIDDEFLLVAGLDDSETPALEIERAFNGSQAAAHLDEAEIYIYRPMGTIVQIAMRLVKWRYEQRHNDAFDRSYVAGTGIVTTPTSLPADVERILGPRKAR
jgi:hypothetical protein